MAGPIRISILGNGSHARRDAALTARAYTGMGRTIRGAAGAAGIGALAAATVGLVKNAVSLEAKFSTTMSTIAAATGATAGEVRKLDDLAMKLGADTSFSANEAADAMLELAKAGLTTKQIIGGGVAGTLQLAAAGGTELGTAATIASNAMNAFNLAGKDMASVAAALAGGANASSASVESLGMGLSQVSAGAVNAGLSLQETVGALSAFDAAGIKGSDAGTSLKTMLQRLVPTTTKARDEMERLGLDFVKGNGQFESLTNIAGQLEKRLGGLSDAERSVALQTIFGSDAQRAATVLMRKGEDGIRKFISATKDQDAAQEMAEARMSGTAGALERLSGAFETAQLRLGKALAPTIQKLADIVGDELEPAMEAAIDNAKVFGEAVEPATKVLKALGEAAVGAVKFLNGLPAPVKEIGIQVGIAALVFPRLAAGVTSATTAMGFQIARLRQLRAELTYTATRAQLATAAMSKLGGAARAAGGIGGMVALTQGAGRADTAVGGLLTTAGAAAVGFSVGGPIGAAVGGLAGGFYTLYQRAQSVNQQWQESEPKAANYAESLDQVTGAATRATRALVLQQLQTDGMVQAAGQLGISTRDLVGATLGQEGAMRRVARATKGSSDIVAGLTNQKLVAWIRDNNYALEASQRELQRNTRDLKTWKQALSGVPPKVITRLRQLGFSASRQQVMALKRQYDLTPKQVRTIFRAIGTGKVRNEAKGVGKAVRESGNVKPSNKWVQLLTGDIDTGKRQADRGGKAIGNNLRNGTGKAKPNLVPFTRLFTGDLSGLKGTASSGGSQIGSNLGSGIAGGISAWVGPIAANAAYAVRQAVAAAKAEARIKSPSRVMRDEVGAQLGAGLVIGLRRSGKDAKRAGSKLIRRFLEGVTEGSDGVRKALDRITQLIEKKLDGKKQAGRRKALLRSLRDENKQLTRNGRLQDRLARKLDRADQKLKARVQAAKQYRNTIRDSVVDYGSVVGLGAVGGSTSVVSLKNLLSQLEARAGAAAQYGRLLDRLRASGLNRTSIQDLLDAGVEGGLATAEAIAAGGASAITQINSLTAQIGASGSRLGDKMTTAYHEAGVRAAEGLVRGLEKRQRQLDRVAQRLARSLVRQVKKELGIRSPSRVFQGIGSDVMGGLALSLDQTRARSLGAATAGALVTGFGTPALDATAAHASAVGAGREVRFRLTADQVSRLQRGREIVADVDAFRAAGGRARTF